ncbi:MAG: hypothetical protein CMC96_04400 [Flavobacteriales bacterium]|nr:hypothetical protein [Flavobacteriales bacterium]
MTKKNKAILLALLTFLLLIGSIILAVIAFSDIKNYSSPYWFSILVATFGLLIGLLIWKKSKNFFYRNALKKDKVSNLSLFVVFATVGFCLFIFNQTNKLLSTTEDCDSHQILSKTYQEHGYLKPSYYAFLINLNGDIKKVYSDYDYWKDKRQGHYIKVCSYSSKLGFDYMMIKN